MTTETRNPNTMNLDIMSPLEIVTAMARARGVTLSESELRAGAERFALARGGRSPRCAKKYVESLFC